MTEQPFHGFGLSSQFFDEERRLTAVEEVVRSEHARYLTSFGMRDKADAETDRSMDARFVFDVTELIRRAEWDQRPSGIPRVQLEAAMIMAEMPFGPVEFCIFNRNDRVYERVAVPTVLQAAARMRAGNQQSHDPPAAGARRQARELAKVAVRKLAGRSHATAQHLERCGHHVLRAMVEARQAVNAAKTEHRWRTGPRDCLSDGWSAATTYCSIGSDWVFGDLDYLNRRREEIGFRVALTVYDLTPILTPQYHEFTSATDFTSHCKQLVGMADVVLVISMATGDDVQSFAEDHGVPAPTMVYLPVGSDLLNAAPAAPRQMAADDPLNGGRYVLNVGTVEIRKNHHLLLDVWEMLVNELGPDEAPRLVVAGQRGWMATETFARLTRTPSLRGIVSFIEKPTDAELAWLYRNCEFTVYPAQYEGWGLPVSESLDFNKMCVTTNGSSLPEAGEGLTELLDPFDRAEWKNCILRFWTDRDLLAARELKIQRRHRPVTARDTTTVLLGL